MTGVAQVIDEHLSRLRRSGAEVRTLIDRWGVENYFYVWRAATPQPRAVIQIVHGIGEHAGRYIHLAERFTEAGFDVVADDHRGHGATGAVALLQAAATAKPRVFGVGNGSSADAPPSSGSDADIMALQGLARLGAGGLEATILAVHAVSRAATELGSGRPPVLLGHSWGSFIAQHLLNIRSREYAAAVLTGTGYCQPGWITTSRFNRRWQGPGATGYEWLSTRPDVARDFAADPLTTGRTVLSSHGFWDALRLLTRPTPSIRSDLPLMIANGSEDPVGGRRSAERLAHAYREVGLQHIDLRIYEGMRHEIFNEVGGDRVIDDVLTWIRAQV